jgi:carbonic anhydrase
MEHVLDRAAHFRGKISPAQQALYQRLASDGQSPKALMISCADSRVVPELITQAAPGDLFVCRNAGNIVPPFSQANGGVSSAVEYAVVALGVRDIVVCGHSDCGAMKAFSNPTRSRSHAQCRRLAASQPRPPIAWSARPIRTSKAAGATRADGAGERRRQINHLRTHPSVASALAQGELTLHGWFFDIETGEASSPSTARAAIFAHRRRGRSACRSP